MQKHIDFQANGFVALQPTNHYFLENMDLAQNHFGFL
jgi:hypothetical protein